MAVALPAYSAMDPVPPPAYDDLVQLTYPSQAHISCLPCEMVSYIMQYLSISDRKDAALVCRSWYQASLEPKIQKNLIISVNASATKTRPFTGLRNRPGFHLALTDIDGSSNSEELLHQCSTHLGPKLLTLNLKGSSVSENTLISILTTCTNLTSLDISACNSLLLSGTGLAKRLGGVTLPKLRSLSLSSLRHLSDATFAGFMHLAPQLESLELASTPFLFGSAYLCSAPGSRPNSAALTFERCLYDIKLTAKHLKSLNLSRTSITNTGLEKLAQVPGLQLTKISLVSCKDITDAGVVVLSAMQGSLQHMDISLNSQLTAVSIKHIAANLPRLKYLNMTKIRLQVTEAKILQSLSSCDHLVLSGSILQTISDQDAHMAFKMWSPHLTSLDLSYCSGLNNRQLVTMCEHLINLSELNLSSCFRLDDVTVRQICKRLLQLTKLSFAWCKHITDLGLLGLYHEDFTHSCVNECRCARERDIAYFEYTPPVKDIAPREIVPTHSHLQSALTQHGYDGSFPVSRLCQLTHLDLSVCSKISDVSIASVVKFPSLVSLNLSMCTRITDRSLIALSNNNPLLEHVDISKCAQVTDQGLLALLNGCRRLTSLNISSCSLITDDAIFKLIEMKPKLKVLDISMCNLTNKAIDELEHFTSLHTIHKRYTSI